MYTSIVMAKESISFYSSAYLEDLNKNYLAYSV
jgi:hypothetical protein